MKKMQKHNFDKHRHAFRVTYVKTQGIVNGKLQVLGNLPVHLRREVFATPRNEYDVVARYANEPHPPQDNHEPGLRGLAMKVFGVTGARPEDVHKSVTTQDFFFKNAPMIKLIDVDTTLDIIRL